jgi:CheY-like chemotaxis protein
MVRQAEKRAKILIVDDDELVLALLAEKLNSVLYQVETCKSGEDAIASFGPGSFDLAVLDYQMPGCDGLDVADQFRKRNQPFIFLSSSTERTVAETAAKHGALSYLVKPASPEAIEIAIETALYRCHEIHNLGKAMDVHGIVGVAAGLIMREKGLSMLEAIAELRRYCRPKNLTLHHVSEQLVEAYEQAVAKDGKVQAGSSVIKRVTG